MPREPLSGFTRIASLEPCRVDWGGVVRQAFVWDVSVVGAYLALDVLPAVAERVILTFSLPGDAVPIRTAARVVWLNEPSPTRRLGSSALQLPPGCGVEFVGLAAKDRARIERRVRATVALARGRTIRS